MNKGTAEGSIEEIRLVKLLNSNKEHTIWSIIGLNDSRDCYAIHVTRSVKSNLLKRTIKPKSDVYIAKGVVDKKYLLSNDYYLNEDDVVKINLEKLGHTGISVKRIDSHRYQILKTSPSTFEKFFDSPRELGAGVSIYCRDVTEIYKNEAVLKGWGVSIDSFVSYFSKYIEGVSAMFDTSTPQEQILIASTIKTFSNKRMHDIISSDKQILGRVFCGIGLYEEPYVAYWLYEKGEFRKNKEMPFTVTTGSGRSRGDFTVVIKPRD